MLRVVNNPPNPWQKRSILWDEEAPALNLEVYEERARSLLSANESPDLCFRWSANIYRGCYHGCAYCYARRSHQYLDWGAGTDFERRIVIKRNAPQLLHQHFMKSSWRGDAVLFSGNTDAYQPLEASYELTRQCLETCLRFRNPISIITKGAVIRRDIELLQTLHQQASVYVVVSIPFADDAMARRIEPYTPPSSRRFETLRMLSQAGIPTGISLAPMIPGLNDADAPALLEQARDAGAEFAFVTLVRLSDEVREVFFERLTEHYPDRVDKVRHALMEMREGKLSNGQFHQRMQGKGKRWDMAMQLFHRSAKRLGLNQRPMTPRPHTFQRPEEQLMIFQRARLDAEKGDC